MTESLGLSADSSESQGGKEPIFVVGTARSGTTLTYSLLLASGAFPIYEAESRILECSLRYGSLRSMRNRRRFLADFFESRQFLRSGLTEEEMVRLVDQAGDSYMDLLDLFMEAICEKQGKKRWVEKSPNNAFFVDWLSCYYPDSRFIHVVRDGRAVALSQRKLGWGEKYSRDPRRQLIWIGNIWELQVSAAQQAAGLGEERYLEIRYEDLVTDLGRSLEKISQFARVTLDPSVAESSSVGSLGGANTAFGTASGGVSARSTNRWRTTLDADEIALLNWQLGDHLGRLGYLEGQAFPEWRPSPMDRVTARVSRWVLVMKRWLNRWTPVGRFARKPLEIGLS